MNGDSEEEHAWEREAARRIRDERASRGRFDVDGPATGRTMQRLLVGGLGLIMVGTLVFFTQWPHLDTGSYAHRPKLAGDIRWAMFGLFINGLGGLFCSVACVAWGVSLGYRHGREVGGAGH